MIVRKFSLLSSDRLIPVYRSVLVTWLKPGMNIDSSWKQTQFSHAVGPVFVHFCRFSKKTKSSSELLSFYRYQNSIIIGWFNKKKAQKNNKSAKFIEKSEFKMIWIDKFSNFSFKMAQNVPKIFLFQRKECWYLQLLCPLGSYRK